MSKVYLTTSCLYCGNIFTYYPLKSRDTPRLYCSRICSQRGRGKGGCIRQDGYRDISIDGHRILEHRHVMELHLGRKLLDTEVVHHKDHDRLNNSIDNLELVPSNSEHRKMHATGYRDDTHKECVKCNIIKPRSEFSPNSKSKSKSTIDPNESYCKKCQQERKSTPEALAQRRLTRR